ncbi:TetR/AcrR family transcriptional regulator [Amycolatopsis jejuensis]|uniref:TetR/AcrR family transcriptional regulator n=1 Tax=Amycolatopsis jejuensis TaxID=330084 RepID=UPI00068A2AB9|nr:TetR/AcrR family transcriptional regulator [Amycolatopsis jejuensis]
MTPRTGRAAGAGKAANGGTRRSELLGIAAQLFATRGYSQTTVRDIADEAGILSGSLYHHFASKEDMLREILREFMDDLLAAFTGIAAQEGTPREQFDALVHTAFATIHERPFAVALYQNESAVVGSLADFEFVGKTSAKIEKLWLGVLQSGRDSGDFRDDLEISLAYRFIRDTVWTSVRWYHPRGKLRHDVVAQQYLTMLYGGLLAG